jgi:AAA+ superfamily predicted ATPase
MNAPDPRLDWSGANQRFLVAEFNRIRRRLVREPSDAPDPPAESRLSDSLPPAAVDRLSELFGLSVFERDLLLLCAGVEMDSALAAACADAAGSTSQFPWPNFGLALALFDEPHWSALAPLRPLRRWRFIEVDESTPLVTARLRIDERLLHYLAGINVPDARLQPLLRPVEAPSMLADAHSAAVERIVQQLARAGASLPVLQLWGDDPDGRRDVAALVASRGGMQLYTLAATDLPTAAHELEGLAALWEREAALLDAGLLIECGEEPPGASALRFMDRIGNLVILSVREPVRMHREGIRQRIDKPDDSDRVALWRRALGPGGESTGAALGIVGGFRLSTRDIARIADACRQTPDDPAEAMRCAVRDLHRPRLDGLAQCIEPRVTLDDLVLREPQAQALRQIVSQVRHRATVHEQWGFAVRGVRGLGMAILLAGESGTGKTMAAEALAGELRLDLIRVDLSALVSKYIGETEKNLPRVFEAAEDSAAVLLFDEADALFGRRSEVKDSHDRYANIEVSYLLQRMEAYRGLAILTTNQKTALDPAFQRRLRAIVNFPFPDVEERAEIWRRAFPAAAPTDGLDVSKLQRLHMSGGQIRNIAVTAAFFAAEAGEPVRMAHIARAAHSEAAKGDRAITETEIRGWG